MRRGRVSIDGKQESKSHCTNYKRVLYGPTCVCVCVYTPYMDL
jgi:hypothetical protein